MFVALVHVYENCASNQIKQLSMYVTYMGVIYVILLPSYIFRLVLLGGMFHKYGFQLEKKINVNIVRTRFSLELFYSLVIYVYMCLIA